MMIFDSFLSHPHEGYQILQILSIFRSSPYVYHFALVLDLFWYKHYCMGS